MAYVVSTSLCDGEWTFIASWHVSPRRGVGKKNLTCIIRIPCVVPEQDSLSEEVVQGIRGPGETLKPESGEAAVEFN